MIFSEHFSLNRKSWLQVKLCSNDWPEECEDFADVWINNSEQLVWKQPWAHNFFAAFYSKGAKQNNVEKLFSGGMIGWESESWY